MARILFLEVDEGIRFLLQETLEKHGYRVQYQETTPGLRLISDSAPNMSFVLSLDGEMTCLASATSPKAKPKSGSAFLPALLRALSAWPS